MDFSKNQKAAKHARHEVTISGRIDIDDNRPVFSLNAQIFKRFGITLLDIAKNRTIALHNIGKKRIWEYDTKTISKRMHDWAIKVGFDWGEISSHSNRGGNISDKYVLSYLINFSRIFCFVTTSSKY